MLRYLLAWLTLWSPVVNRKPALWIVPRSKWATSEDFSAKLWYDPSIQPLTLSYPSCFGPFKVSRQFCMWSILQHYWNVIRVWIILARSHYLKNDHGWHIWQNWYMLHPMEDAWTSHHRPGSSVTCKLQTSCFRECNPSRTVWFLSPWAVLSLSNSISFSSELSFSLLAIIHLITNTTIQLSSFVSCFSYWDSRQKYNIWKALQTESMWTRITKLNNDANKKLSETWMKKGGLQR